MSKNKPNFELGRDPYTGQFASIKDIFPKHQQGETEPEHLEWRAPESPAGFRNPQPSPEDILIAHEEFGDRIDEFVGDIQTEDDFDIWSDPWLKEMTEDEEKIKAAGDYRGRAGEAFISTQYQFDEWGSQAYLERKYDEGESEYPANRQFRADEIGEISGIPYTEKGEDVQNKFEANAFIKFRKHIIAKIFSRYYLRRLPDGDRQLGSKRGSREKREGRQIKYRNAA